MTKQSIGNLVATTAAVLCGAATMYISIRFLRKPESMLDWAVMVFAGLVTGIFVFFLVWGHFQGSGKPTHVTHVGTDSTKNGST